MLNDGIAVGDGFYKYDMQVDVIIICHAMPSLRSKQCSSANVLEDCYANQKNETMIRRNVCVCSSSRAGTNFLAMIFRRSCLHTSPYVIISMSCVNATQSLQIGQFR